MPWGGRERGRLSREACAECWLEVYDNAVEPRFYGLALAGERLSLELQGRAQIVLHTCEVTDHRVATAAPQALRHSAAAAVSSRAKCGITLVAKSSRLRSVLRCDTPLWS